MSSFLSRKSRRAILFGSLAALLTGIGFAVGMLVAGFGNGSGSELMVPESLLYASATDSTDKFVVATGPVEPGLEGVFFLDPLSGDLQCTVFNPRAGVFNSVFRRNVLADFPRYGLATAKLVMDVSFLACTPWSVQLLCSGASLG
ncbi:MAG: hypothetical protein AAF497_09665 [Planctomycetota bacterium]